MLRAVFPFLSWKTRLSRWAALLLNLIKRCFSCIIYIICFANLCWHIGIIATLPNPHFKNNWTYLKHVRELPCSLLRSFLKLWIVSKENIFLSTTGTSHFSTAFHSSNICGLSGTFYERPHTMQIYWAKVMTTIKRRKEGIRCLLLKPTAIPREWDSQKCN